MCNINVTIIDIISINFFFFFNDTATTEIYTLSLHDALPISLERTVDSHISKLRKKLEGLGLQGMPDSVRSVGDRKSTRLNSSHGYISYAVFCLKKKKKHNDSSNETKMYYIHQ